MLLLLGFAAATASVLFIIWNIDSWFLMRLGLPYLYFSKRKEAIKDIFRTHVFHSLVLPVDLDFLGHMNNARYLREAEFARCHFFAPYKILDMLQALGGRMAMTASCCRYRRALNVFERFDIHTRILGWDGRAVYVEHLFVRPRNGFVVAVMRAQFCVTGTTPAVLMEHLAGKKVESPEMPKEVLHWIKYNEISSQRMRVEGDSQNNDKDR